MLIVLAGPTAVGKSDLAMDLAERLGMEIISADSRQVYTRLEIGTARPSAADCARVPHHLVGYVEPDEEYSAARFARDANAVLDELAGRGLGAIVVGGTGHYVQALVEGIQIPSVPPDLDFRAALEREAEESGGGPLFERLVRLDPEAARSIPAANVRRVIRALEVIEKTGRRFSEVGRVRSVPRRAARLALTRDRSELYARADARVDAMILRGWLEEVRALMDRGYSPTGPALTSTGYRELVAHIHGESTLDQTVQRIKWATHAYIRRQYMWLRKQPGYRWLDLGQATLDDVERACHEVWDAN